MKNSMFLVISVLMTLAACTNSQGNANLAKSKAREAIYDGELTTDENLISKTTVLINTGTGYCSGSLLSPTIIITAAHCVTEGTLSRTLKPTDKLAILHPSKNGNNGYWMIDTVKGATVEKIIAHPIFMGLSDVNFHYQNGYDVALIKLQNPMPAPYIPVEISDDFEALSQNQIRIAGFGAHSNDFNQATIIDGQLRNGGTVLDLNRTMFSLPVNSQGQPKEIPVLVTNRPESSVLSFVKGPQDSSVCHGDSGGPVYFEKDGKIHLVGVNQAIKSMQNCAANGESQLIVNLAGPSLRFVLDSYRELTGESLPNKVFPLAEQDPHTFEFHLKRKEPHTKNEDINIEGLSLIHDENTGESAFLETSMAESSCKTGSISLTKYPTLILLNQKANLEGKIPVPLLITKDNVYQEMAEARIEVHGDIAKTAILTTKGYLSAEMPFLKCSPSQMSK